MKIVGLDVHAASFTVALLTEEGRLAWVRSNNTTAHNLIEVVSQVVGPKALVVEESHLAQWVKRTLERYVDRLVICDPRHNEWISKAQYNDDRHSAEKLARLLRQGSVRPIAHPDEGAEDLRGLFLHYFDVGRELATFRNKLKATFRQEAIPTQGTAVYDHAAHASWLRKLRGRPHLAHEARQHFAVVDLLAELKEQTFKKMVGLARRESAYKLLASMPGAGPVTVTGYIALIETPHRFSKENKLWSYGGFANRRHTSDQVVYHDHASHEGNRVLKWVVMQQYTAAVERSKDQNRFQRLAAHLRGQGLGYGAVRRQVCRALLSTARALWMKGELYRDDPLS
jgi:transposase